MSHNLEFSERRQSIGFSVALNGSRPIFRSATESPWFCLQPEDLMVHNDSQDQNISLLTEVWPWSVSRELSVRPYFGTYLQTSMQSLFRFVSFFLLGTSP